MLSRWEGGQPVCVCAHTHAHAHARVTVCACVTRSRTGGPSKSGTSVNVELMRKAKTGQHKIKKGSRDRSTQVREPDKTNPRTPPRTGKNGPCGQRLTLQDDRKTKNKNTTQRQPEHNGNKIKTKPPLLILGSQLRGQTRRAKTGRSVFRSTQHAIRIVSVD